MRHSKSGAPAGGLRLPPPASLPQRPYEAHRTRRNCFRRLAARLAARRCAGRQPARVTRRAWRARASQRCVLCRSPRCWRAGLAFSTNIKYTCRTTTRVLHVYCSAAHHQGTGTHAGAATRAARRGLADVAAVARASNELPLELAVSSAAGCCARWTRGLTHHISRRCVHCARRRRVTAAPGHAARRRPSRPPPEHPAAAPLRATAAAAASRRRARAAAPARPRARAAAGVVRRTQAGRLCSRAGARQHALHRRRRPRLQHSATRYAATLPRRTPAACSTAATPAKCSTGRG